MSPTQKTSVRGEVSNQNESSTPTELRLAALHNLAECDPTRKAQSVRELAKLSDSIELDANAILIPQQLIPGRPQQPELVAPRLLKHRSMVTPEGRATLIHAMAHIEFNAINLALDALWRFPNMPRAYYTDWLMVAGEEALHFSLLAEHLQNLGYQYGDFPAHNSLWEMADKTKHDILARIALVPRTMEARGLDATPQVRAKLA
ncbi:MAG: ferritin-like domain-containing protein, partial [Gallionella sp.]|nr:ferritin-like domain-containing protein [Gallionella sp.]